MSMPLIDDDALAALCTQVSGEGTLDRAALTAALAELQARRAELASEERLSKGQLRLMELTRAGALGRGDLDAALLEITEAATEILGIERASVWRYTEDQAGIICIELYRASEGIHESGIELSAADFPAYFEAIASDRIIAADDAHTDPSTAEFSEVYLGPLGINSMLDAPVRIGDQMLGVLCCEHVGPARPWSAVEKQLARSLADFTALAFETSRRREIEQELRTSVELAEQRLDTIERQRMAIADLSAPIIDVWTGVLVLPIVGLVDTQRSLELTERLLERIAASKARSVIVDLTGVDVVDTMTANHLLQMVRAAKLLGTFCVLSGISPLIAQTLVQLDVNLREITTVRSLKEGLQTCITRQV